MRVKRENKWDIIQLLSCAFIWVKRYPFGKIINVVAFCFISFTTRGTMRTFAAAAVGNGVALLLTMGRKGATQQPDSTFLKFPKVP